MYKDWCSDITSATATSKCRLSLPYTNRTSFRLSQNIIKISVMFSNHFFYHLPIVFHHFSVWWGLELMPTPGGSPFKLKKRKTQYTYIQRHTKHIRMILLQHKKKNPEKPQLQLMTNDIFYILQFTFSLPLWLYDMIFYLSHILD